MKRVIRSGRVGGEKYCSWPGWENPEKWLEEKIENGSMDGGKGHQQGETLVGDGWEGGLEWKWGGFGGT